MVCFDSDSESARAVKEESDRRDRARERHRDSKEGRKEREREGIYRTLSAIYYFQSIGLKWSVAEDEGYKTPYNQRAMKERVAKV